MRKAIFLVVLMYSSAAVFGMQDGKRSFSDESAEPSQKVRIVKVNEELPELLDKQTLEKKIGAARREKQKAKKDIKNFQWLYNDALSRAQSADERTKLITQMFGKDICLARGIPQEKEKAEKDAMDYLMLFKDARIRKKNADMRIDTLTQMFQELEISNQNTTSNKIDNSKVSSQIIENNRGASSSVSFSIDRSKSNTMNLYNYCKRENSKVALSDIVFDYFTENNLFNCKVVIKNKYIDKCYYDKRFVSKSKKEAKEKIAGVILKDLLSNKKLNKANEEDGENYIAKLNEYLLDKNTDLNLSDLLFEYEINIHDGTYNCKVNIPKLNKSYDRKLKCKSKKEAKEAISEYVYDILTGGARL